MNSDESFEAKLRAQTFHPIPSQWKKSLLPKEKTASASSWTQIWALIFQPYRHAYAALALFWIIIALLHWNTPVSSSSPGIVSGPSLPPSKLLANWLEKQRFLAAEGSNPIPQENLIR